jgi:hypothetical protein
VLVPGGKIEQDALVRFLDGLPQTVDEVHRRVSADSIAAFRQQAPLPVPLLPPPNICMPRSCPEPGSVRLHPNEASVEEGTS